MAQAYPLMVNRFGNFLVQRCFEHGTPEQVIKIAGTIRGNTRNLSMDPFGCHVVQKAFDSVPEDYKCIMVRELLRRIPETVIHRYACHVWQKLFELRWTESPPQILKYVNEALRGMWHEVALGETGSLVVQNIFENCLEEDKVSRPLPDARGRGAEAAPGWLLPDRVHWTHHGYGFCNMGEACSFTQEGGLHCAPKWQWPASVAKNDQEGRDSQSAEGPGDMWTPRGMREWPVVWTVRLQTYQHR